MATQNKEIQGTLEAGSYLSPSSETLMETLRQTRSDLESPLKTIAQTEMHAWQMFVDSRRNEIPIEQGDEDPGEEPGEYGINQKFMGLIRENFDRHKNRKTHLLSPSKIVDFHNDLGQKFLFDIRFHPRNMSQMVHPF